MEPSTIRVGGGGFDALGGGYKVHETDAPAFIEPGAADSSETRSMIGSSDPLESYVDGVAGIRAHHQLVALGGTVLQIHIPGAWKLGASSSTDASGPEDGD